MLDSEQTLKLQARMSITLLEFLFRIHCNKQLRQQKTDREENIPNLGRWSKLLSYEGFVRSLMADMSRVDFSKILSAPEELDIWPTTMDAVHALSAPEAPWTLPECPPFGDFPVLLGVNIYGYKQSLQITNNPCVSVFKAEYLINAAVFGQETVAFIEVSDKLITFGLADDQAVRSRTGAFKSCDTVGEQLWGHHAVSIMLQLQRHEQAQGRSIKSSIYSHELFQGADRAIDQGPYSTSREIIIERD